MSISFLQCDHCKSLDHVSDLCNVGCKKCIESKRDLHFFCSYCGIPVHKVRWCTICDERGHTYEKCDKMEDEYSYSYSDLGDSDDDYIHRYIHK